MTLRGSGELKKKISELLVVRATGHMFDSQRKYPLWEVSNQELKNLLDKLEEERKAKGYKITEIQD